ADGIGPIRGARGKDAGERTVAIRTRVYLQSFAIGAMQPGDDDNLVSRGEKMKSLRETWLDFKPGVWRALGRLSWRVAALLEGGAKASYRTKKRLGSSARPFAIPFFSFHRGRHWRIPVTNLPHIFAMAESRRSAKAPLRYTELRWP